MDLIQKTDLWKNSLGNSDKYSDSIPAIRRLVESFTRFRQHALDFSRQLTQDLRQLTVHDETHTDALWEVYDVIFLPDMISNPLEAYVLGGAFLIHDLGHALCLYPKGLDQLKTTDAWKRATNLAILTGSDASFILENAIRFNHAELATSLATASFGEGVYLIDDAEIRNHLGSIIGLVAYSHWWNHHQLNSDHRLSMLGAIPIIDCPGSWTIDSQKLGYILRTCDACQIDGRRAPIFVESLRKPTGIAANHWGAQRRLAKPFIEDNEIKFTSTQPFTIDAIDDWWTAFDLAQNADRELKELDGYLRSRKKAAKVKGVAGATSPSAFSRHVKVDAWVPVETRPSITSVAEVIQRLGGYELYGADMLVPLRELIQNSRDAIEAKRVIEGHDQAFGNIRVTVADQSATVILTVSDNGIGMSDRTMLHFLLDFGRSYWTSMDCISDHPTLDLTCFSPVGKYGIGFFSVFMLGKKIKVISRTNDEGKRDTRVLEFKDGLQQRPVLRRANSEEQLMESGTTVAVELYSKETLRRILTPKREKIEGLMNDAVFRDRWTLSEAIEWLCPASDVSIDVQESMREVRAVGANDWRDLAPEGLFRRLFLHREDIDRMLSSNRSRYHLESLQPVIGSDGKILARASLTDNFAMLHDNSGLYGIVTNGPFRSSIKLLFPGLLLGTPDSVTRSQSRPIALEDYTAISLWATAQMKLAMHSAYFRDSTYKYGLAAYVRSLGGDIFDWPLFVRGNVECSLREIILEGLPYQEVYLYPFDYHTIESPPPNFDTNNLCHIGVRLGRMTNGKLLNTPDPLKRSSHKLWNQYWYSLWGAAIEAIAKAWGCDLTQLLEMGSSVDSGDDFNFEPAIFRRPT